MPLPALKSGLLLHFTCSVCGFLIIRRQDASRFSSNLEQHGVSCNAASEWLSEFRACKFLCLELIFVLPLILFPVHSKEPFLSGVSRNLEPVGIVEGRAPLDPQKHCDEENDQERDNVTFGFRSYSFPGLESSDIGYPIHESCWQLLHHQAHLHGVDDLMNPRYTHFLYRLHHSALDDPGRDWADDYGGLLDTAGMNSLSIFTQYAYHLVLFGRTRHPSYP